jgi:hypothetical protein
VSRFRYVVRDYNVLPINREIGTEYRIRVSPEVRDNVRIAKFSLVWAKLEQLSNIDTETFGLSGDNPVLVYNNETEKWIVTPFESLDIDGGFY